MNMRPLLLGQPPRPQHPYMGRSLSVTPNPPVVGQPCRLAVALQNSTAAPIEIARVEMRIAPFGMGMEWENVPTPGAITVAPGATHDIEASWTPTTGGHRCVRATIEQIAPTPWTYHLGCNLDVIDAEAHEGQWRIPFHMGNPTAKPAPIELVIGDASEQLDALVLVHGRPYRRDQPIWLDPGAAAEAEVLLRAARPGMLAAIQTVEARIHGQLIDGIAIVVRRRAPLTAGMALPAERYSAPADLVMAR
jgi:hypothetical protein